jgi:crossover junction endodeoxyribonuclease RuvC
MVIVGIDPGLNTTGFGIIRAEASRLHLLAAGDIRPPRGAALPERLACLQATLVAQIQPYQPAVAVLEKIFTHYRHLSTAAKMAHARGAACLAVQACAIPLVEYLPTRIKHAVTGRGNATKQQVALMIEHWLGQRDPRWSLDATDALALAIAHAHIQTAPVGATVGGKA